MLKTLFECLVSLPIEELNDEISVWFNDEHVSGKVVNFIKSDYASMLVSKYSKDKIDEIRTYVLKEVE